MLDDGAVWLAGSCGIRGVLDAAGRFTDHRVPWKLFTASLAGTTYSCPATVSSWSVWARASTEVYVVGDKRCGMDPNSIWPIPLERFDGKVWKPLPSKFPGGADPHHQSPDRLAGNARDLYALALGDDWHGPPHCGLFRYEASGWGKGVKLCKRPKASGDRFEVFKDFAVARDGTVWVVGQLWKDEQSIGGAAWWFRGKETGQIAVDDPKLAQVSIATDGTLWAAGTHLWRAAGNAFDRLSSSSEPTEALWARSRDRAWLVRAGIPLVFDKNREHPVDVEPADSEAPHIYELHGAGDHVWALGRQVAWSLEHGASGREPITIDVTAPTSADYPAPKR